jgi:hypothetical protein
MADATVFRQAPGVSNVEKTGLREGAMVAKEGKGWFRSW